MTASGSHEATASASDDPRPKETDGAAQAAENPNLSTEPYWLERRPRGREGVGVLLVHGFTASPTETRPLADYLNRERGWLCHGVKLAGHGCADEQALDSTDRFDWLRTAEDGFRALEQRGCTHIFLVGVSMGGALCCELAYQYLNKKSDATGKDLIRGLILISPCFSLRFGRALLLRILGLFRRYLEKGGKKIEYFKEKGLMSYHRVPLAKLPEVLSAGSAGRRVIKGLRAPVYVVLGLKDDIISLRAAREAYRKAWKPGSRLVQCPNSGHILTVEPDANVAFETIVEFIDDCLGGDE